MDEPYARITRTSGMNPWRAACGGSRTSGSEGGPEKPTTREAGRALRSDPYTKLLGPQKWTYYYLYVIIDFSSRYVPTWMLAHAENAQLAEALLADTVTKQHIGHGQLTIHADRGSPMVAKPVAFLLADLGVTKSHSRPHVSNDNPFSESQFRTMKYRPRVPRPVRQLRRRPRLLQPVLQLVQQRPPPLRHRVPHPRRRPLRAS